MSGARRRTGIVSAGFRRAQQINQGHKYPITNHSESHQPCNAWVLHTDSPEIYRLTGCVQQAS